MPDTTPETSPKTPTRRAVLRVGANAAWAVPAVQVVSAVTQYAAASGAASLTMNVVSHSQSGNTLTLSVTVTAPASQAVTGVAVTVSGDGTGPIVKFGNLSKGVTSAPGTITVTLKNTTGQLGAVGLSATGTAGTTTITGSTGVYATSVLSFGTISQIRKADNSGAILVPVSAAYAPATGVKVTVTRFNGTSSTSTSLPVDVTVGAPVTVSVPISSFGGDTGSTPTVRVNVTAGATNNGGQLPVTAPSQKTYTATTAVNVATLTIANFNPNRAAVWDWATFSWKWSDTETLSFNIGTDVAAKSISWAVTAAGVATPLASGTTPDLAAKGTSPRITTSYKIPRGTSVTLAVTGVTTSSAYPAVGATATTTA